MTFHEIIYGGHGCGKSSYAMDIIDANQTHKIGYGGFLEELTSFRFGFRARHRRDTIESRISFTEATSVAQARAVIDTTTKSTLFIDDWTTISTALLLRSKQEVEQIARKLIERIEANPYITRAVYIVNDHVPSALLPWSLYKKREGFNKTLASSAHKQTKIELGHPVHTFYNPRTNPDSLDFDEFFMAKSQK